MCESHHFCRCLARGDGVETDLTRNGNLDFDSYSSMLNLILAQVTSPEPRTPDVVTLSFHAYLDRAASIKS